MTNAVLYQIRLAVSDEKSAGAWDVIEIEGSPHAVVRFTAESFVAIKLDPALIRDLPPTAFLDRMTCEYGAAVDFTDAKEFSFYE